jgi:hypothetical protein
MGTGEKQRLLPIQLEVIKKHLKVCGAHTRIRDMAIGKSEIKYSKHDSHIPDNHKLLGPTP